MKCIVCDREMGPDEDWDDDVCMDCQNDEWIITGDVSPEMTMTDNEESHHERD